MDGLVVLAGAVVLLLVALWALVLGLGKLVQRLERRYPDPQLPPLRAFIRRGCDYDERKFLEGKRRMVERQLDHLVRRHEYLTKALAARDESALVVEARP